MKTIWNLFIVLMMIVACAKKTDNFNGKEYELMMSSAEAEITIGFDKKENRCHGQSAVNRYFGSYELTDNEIKFGAVGATMMMGPQSLMELEMQYLQDLAKVKKYKLEDKKLYLYTDDGKELVFEEVSA